MARIEPRRDDAMDVALRENEETRSERPQHRPNAITATRATIAGIATMMMRIARDALIRNREQGHDGSVVRQAVSVPAITATRCRAPGRCHARGEPQIVSPSASSASFNPPEAEPSGGKDIVLWRAKPTVPRSTAQSRTGRRPATLRQLRRSQARDAETGKTEALAPAPMLSRNPGVSITDNNQCRDSAPSATTTDHTPPTAVSEVEPSAPLPDMRRQARQEISTSPG